MFLTERLILKKALCKLKSDEILIILKRWSGLGKHDFEALRQQLDTKFTKLQVTNIIADYCVRNGKLNMETVGELELLCIQMHPEKRQWSSYQMTEKKGGSKFTTPAKFKQKLVKLIRLYFNQGCTTAVVLHAGIVWGRVYLPKTATDPYRSSRCLYFVHYPDTPIVIFSGMQTGFESFITHCLISALGYKKITEMSLAGHHIESIAELAINKFSEGGYSKFQKTHQPNGPLGLSTIRKRKEPDTPFDDSVIDENRQMKRQRLGILTDSFGEFEQPSLEKIEYKIELPYRSKTVAADIRASGEIFESRVKFIGKNVLEGIRNLGEHGYASVPLPKHLTCIPSRARNYFLLTKGQKPSQAT